MTMFEVNDLGPCDSKGSGVRVSGELLHTYDLTVIAADVDGVVAAAGGWLCDRVRAGWQVTVLVPADSDMRALTILGVHAEVVDAVAVALRSPAAAVALDARVLRQDHVRHEVLRLVDEGHAEITVWGESSLFGADRRFDAVRHRVSAAARAFKAGALRTTGQTSPDPAVEEFLSAALWYPPDGADLVPVPGR